MHLSANTLIDVIFTDRQEYSLAQTMIEAYLTPRQYEPKHHVPNFTYPAYVPILGDFGEPVTGYCYRFKPLEEASEGNHV